MTTYGRMVILIQEYATVLNKYASTEYLGLARQSNRRRFAMLCSASTNNLAVLSTRISVQKP